MELDYRDIMDRIAEARQLRSEALAELVAAGWHWLVRHLGSLHLPLHHAKVHTPA